MKTTRLFSIACVAIAFSSCDSLNDELNVYIPVDDYIDTPRVTVVTAGTSSYSSRTVLSDGTGGGKTLLWSKGDKIRVSDGKTEAVYTTSDQDKSVAEFVNDKATLDVAASEYTAYYPETLSATTLVLPAVQNYVKDGMAGFPMMAVSTTRDLTFRNLCGVMCLRLKTAGDSPVSIAKIVLSSPEAGLSGKFTVDNHAAVVSDNTTDLTLECASPVEVGSDGYTPFYIYLPAGKYDKLRLTLASDDGSELNLVSAGAVDIERSSICNMSVVLDTSGYNGSLENLPVTPDGPGFVAETETVRDSYDGIFSVTDENVDSSTR